MWCLAVQYSQQGIKISVVFIVKENQKIRYYDRNQMIYFNQPD